MRPKIALGFGRDGLYSFIRCPDLYRASGNSGYPSATTTRLRAPLPERSLGLAANGCGNCDQSLITIMRPLAHRPRIRRSIGPGRREAFVPSLGADRQSHPWRRGWAGGRKGPGSLWHGARDGKAWQGRRACECGAAARPGGDAALRNRIYDELFIGLLALPANPALQDDVKVGILPAVLGSVMLLLSPRPGGAAARTF